MNPFYFGSSAEPLFGAYHPPGNQVGRNLAVLICPPLGREYLRAHWALRRLADQISRDGGHVLRFDYFATGDSAGDSKGGSTGPTSPQPKQTRATAARRAGVPDAVKRLMFRSSIESSEVAW